MYSKESEFPEISHSLNIENEQVEQTELRGEAEDQRSWTYENIRSFEIPRIQFRNREREASSDRRAPQLITDSGRL